MNVDQIQSELMSRVRVVWVGAKIPIWLSDFVSLSIKISKYHFLFQLYDFKIMFCFYS